MNLVDFICTHPFKRIMLYLIGRKTSQDIQFRKLLSNFFFLGIVQVSNFILPLLVFPYIVKTIGNANFGVLSFGLSLAFYLSAFAEYGFGMSATKSVANNSTNLQYLSELFKNVFHARLLILLVLLLIGSVLVYTMPSHYLTPRSYVLIIFYILGGFMVPNWFFQGLQRMKYITFYTLLSKLVATVLVFLLIKSENSFDLFFVIYGITNFLVGVLSLKVVYEIISPKILSFSWSQVLYQLKSGSYFFLNNIAIMTFNSGTILILSMFVDQYSLGQYSIAEKVVFSVWQILVVFSQAIYPQLCSMISTSYSRVYGYVWKATLAMSIPVLSLCLMLFTFAEDIVIFATGKADIVVMTIIKIMCFHSFIILLNIPAYQTLLAFSLQKKTAVLFNGIAIFSFILTISMCKSFGIYGCAFSIIAVQIVVTISLHILLKTQEVFIKDNFFSVRTKTS